MSFANIFKGAVLAAAATIAVSSASAVTITLTTAGNQATGSATAAITGTGTSFTHSYDFTVPTGGNWSVAPSSGSILDISLGASGGDIDFDPAGLLFDGAAIFASQLTDAGSGNVAESWVASVSGLLAGSNHTIQVKGKLVTGSAASYSTLVNLNAVPEPATWGMMLVGFGLVGAGMRSRKRTMVLA